MNSRKYVLAMIKDMALDVNALAKGTSYQGLGYESRQEMLLYFAENLEAIEEGYEYISAQLKSMRAARETVGDEQ